MGGKIEIDPLKTIRETVEQTGKAIGDTIEAGKDLVTGAGELVGEGLETIIDPVAERVGAGIEAVSKPITDLTGGAMDLIKTPMKDLSTGLGDITTGAIQGIEDISTGASDLVGGAVELVEDRVGSFGEAWRDLKIEDFYKDVMLDPINELRRFGDRIGLSDTLLDVRDVAGEIVNKLDILDGFQSASEKQAKEEARKAQQALADAEAEAQRKAEIEQQIAKDRASIEQEKATTEKDTTGIGLQDVRIIGGGTSDEEDDEILRSLKKFGGQ